MQRARLPDEAVELPATARLVYLALRVADGELTSAELREQTGASTHRIWRVATLLEERGLVTARDHPGDGRRKLWSATGGAQ